MAAIDLDADQALAACGCKHGKGIDRAVHRRVFCGSFTCGRLAGAGFQGFGEHVAGGLDHLGCDDVIFLQVGRPAPGNPAGDSSILANFNP